MECPLCHGSGMKHGTMCQCCNGTGSLWNNPQVVLKIVVIVLFVLLFMMAMLPVPISLLPGAPVL